MADSSMHASEIVFPNIHRLRSECVERLYSAPREQVSDAEWAGIQTLMIEYIKEVAEVTGRTKRSDWYTDPCLETIGNDLQETEPPLPKWAALASWLGKDGIVKYHPILVTRIVQRALDLTLDQVA